MIALDVLGAGLAGAVRPPSPTPPREVFPAAVRRRVTPLSRLLGEAAAEAADDAGVDLATVPLVFGSAYGEIASTVDIMRSFREVGGLPSPTRFHNSVHNTAAAYLSIATGNHGFATSVAAGDATPAMAFVEAAALLAAGVRQAVIAVGDEPVPAPLARCAYPAAAAAFVVGPAGSPGARARVTIRRGSVERGGDGALAEHPCIGGLELALAVRGSKHATVRLGSEWLAELEVLEQQR